MFPPEKKSAVKLRLTVLGSGTSMGVPTLGCGCRVCASSDSRDKRTRPSVLLTAQERAEEDTRGVGDAQNSGEASSDDSKERRSRLETGATKNQDSDQQAAGARRGIQHHAVI